MKHELKITEDNYREVVLKRGIITCWILLAICLVVKIFGGNFFNIVFNDENFVKFCEYVDKSFIRYIIYFAYFILESSVIIFIIKPDLKFKSLKYFLYLFGCSLFWIIKVLVENSVIKIYIPLFSIISLVILYFILLIFSKKPLYSVLIILYQTALGACSSLIKNISLNGLLSKSAFLTFIFYIDYYIVFVLTLLYVRIKYIKRRKKDGIN